MKKEADATERIDKIKSMVQQAEDARGMKDSMQNMIRDSLDKWRNTLSLFKPNPPNLTQRPESSHVGAPWQNSISNAAGNARVQPVTIDVTVPEPRVTLESTVNAFLTLDGKVIARYVQTILAKELVKIITGKRYLYRGR